MCECMYVRMNICMCTYIYIYFMYIYTIHTHKELEPLLDDKALTPTAPQAQETCSQGVALPVVKRAFCRVPTDPRFSVCCA